MAADAQRRIARYLDGVQAQEKEGNAADVLPTM